jgi:uncharacterized membrane protein
MNLVNEIKIIGIILAIVLVLDGIMITILNSKWNYHVAEIQGSSIKIRSVIFPVIAYILIVIGIRLFVYPYFVLGDIKIGFIMGLVWGVITYGIFDFTNLTLFEDYPLGLAITDTLWGGMLAALTGLLTFTIAKKFNIVNF